MIFLNGIVSSMVTSFKENGELDTAGLIDNIAFQKKAGIKSVCILGGTGEATSLSQEERHKVMEITMDHSDGLNIIFGAVAGKPSDVMSDIQKANDLGADACMVMAPPFYGPSESDVELLMTEFASIGLPLILFNTPSRSGFSMSAELISRLSKLDEIVGIKEGAGDMVLLQDIRQECKNPFTILAGGDIQYLPSMALGADGGLLASAAVVPELLIEIEKAILQADFEKARELHYTLKSLEKVMYKASHPVPLKLAMEIRGLSVGKCRPPFGNINEEHEKQVHVVMKDIKDKLKGKVEFVSDYSF